MVFKTVFQTCRPSFLVLTPVCVLLGLSLAISTTESINYLTFIAIFIGALCAHMSVNMLNEYADFKSGLDFKTEKTSFSGGSGALPSSPEDAGAVLMFGIATLVITVIIGLYFIVTHSAQVLPIGLVGVVIVFTYTKWLNRLPLLCLISPGLGFGVLMVIGTYVVLTNEITQNVWLISIIPFLLINNLLLLNQYPDIEADKTIGRKTFPIAFGLKISNVVYGISIVASYGFLLGLVINDRLPTMSLLALIPIVFSVYSFIGAVKYSSEIGKHPKHLAANVVAAIFTPLLLAISIFIGT